MLRGFTVSVNYSDYLELTLPYNSKLLDEIVIITTPTDDKTKEVASRYSNVKVYETLAFYKYGAVFNKGLAVEEAMDFMGRRDWLLSLDADIVLPQKTFTEYINLQGLDKDKLYTVRRHFIVEAKNFKSEHAINPATWPPDSARATRPVWFSGYFQLFNADSRFLRNKRPWFGINWKHAGGYDSDFRDKYVSGNKMIFKNFYVLHLGPNKANWLGRETAPALSDVDFEIVKKNTAYVNQNKLGQKYQDKQVFNFPKQDYPQWF